MSQRISGALEDGIMFSVEAGSATMSKPKEISYSGYLQLDRSLWRSLLKFVASGVLLGAALWLTARLAVSYFTGLTALHDEAAFLVLILVGALVYVGAILALFGRGWLRSLLRS